jgi:drug/metabolite transporter (DMT)-like permease
LASQDLNPGIKPYSSGILQLLLGAAVISFSPVFVKLADVGPTMAGFYRNLFGAAFLLVLVVARGDSMWKGWRPFLMACATGALFAADLSFWHRSIHYIGPGLSTIFGNFQVFFLAAFGVFVFHEKIDWKFLVSMPLAIVGLFMMVGVKWSALSGDYRLGLLYALVTALTYAFFVLTLKKSQSETPRLSAVANLTVISLVTAVIMGGEAYLMGESFSIPDSRSLASMLAYGVMCQALGWIIISRALAKVEASRAGLILLLQPALAFVWDIIFFARPTDIMDVVGATLALFAIYLGGTRKRA